MFKVIEVDQKESPKKIIMSSPKKTDMSSPKKIDHKEDEKLTQKVLKKKKPILSRMPSILEAQFNLSKPAVDNDEFATPIMRNNSTLPPLHLGMTSQPKDEAKEMINIKSSIYQKKYADTKFNSTEKRKGKLRIKSRLKTSQSQYFGK